MHNELFSKYHFCDTYSTLDGMLWMDMEKDFNVKNY